MGIFGCLGLSVNMQFTPIDVIPHIKISRQSSQKCQAPALTRDHDCVQYYT
jgi:hypothetical protein